MSYFASALGEWDLLRASRADPPTAVTGSDERRATYVFALEQAQQMFTAAAAVGSATQPLLLFYGLSQAGRAIAAAAATIRDEGWKLAGHGIKTGNLEVSLARTTAVTTSGGSFVRLAELLGCPLAKGSEFIMGELWGTLPDVQAWPLEAQAMPRPPLRVAPQWTGPTHPLAAALVSGIPSTVVEAADGDVLRAFLSGYPDAAGFEFVRLGYGAGAPPAFTTGEHDGSGEINLTWTVPEGVNADSFVVGRASRYGDAYYLLPAVGADHVVLHPLLSWWAVLFLLSMLARYSPARWQAHIAVNSSPAAVPLERLLRAAMETVPVLVMQAIREVSGAI